MGQSSRPEGFPLQTDSTDRDTPSQPSSVEGTDVSLRLSQFSSLSWREMNMHGHSSVDNQSPSTGFFTCRVWLPPHFFTGGRQGKVQSADKDTRWSIKKSEECGHIHEIGCAIRWSTRAVATVQNTFKNILVGNSTIALKLSKIMLGSLN